MGVDYYINTYLYVIFKNNTSMVITISREGHYYSFGENSYFSNSEGDNPRAIEEYENMKYTELTRRNSQK
ncbi:MAG: hypothetical protein WD512_11870, partial [Candidatus Paceibacterota bacterium]